MKVSRDEILKMGEITGVEVIEKTEKHFQLKGKLLVNLYPTGGKYHLQGAPKSFYFKSLSEPFDIAKNRETRR